MVERIQSPWIQPCGKRDRDDVPLDWSLSPSPSPSPSSPAPKPLFSPSPLSPTRLERSNSAGRLASAADESGDEGRENEEALFKKPPPVSLYGVTSEWPTGRPRRSCQIPQQVRAQYVAKKVAWRSRRPCLIPSEYRGLLPLRALPEIRIPSNSQIAGQLVRQQISSDPSLGNPQVHKVHSTIIKNRSRRLKEKLTPSLRSH